MGRERNLHLIQNTERDTERDRVQQAIQDTEREISASHTKYKRRDRNEREGSACNTKHRQTQRQI
jgi:hypothetical protein